MAEVTRHDDGTVVLKMDHDEAVSLHSFLDDKAPSFPYDIQVIHAEFERVFDPPGRGWEDATD